MKTILQKKKTKQNHNTWIRKRTYIFERIYPSVTQVFRRHSKIPKMNFIYWQVFVYSGWEDISMWGVF